LILSLPNSQRGYTSQRTAKRALLLPWKLSQKTAVFEPTCCSSMGRLVKTYSTN
jgi:hypothetical protein